MFSLASAIEQRAKDLKTNPSFAEFHYDSLSKFPRLHAIGDTSEPARKLIAEIVGSTHPKFGSWVPGIPLPTLLSAKNPLIVDIAPNFLVDFRSSYGISENTLIEFGKRGLLVFNFRNIDPDGDDEHLHRSIEQYDRFSIVHELLDQIPDKVIFTSLLRDRIFDKIPSGDAVSRSLRDRFETAFAQLEPAAKAASRKLNDFDPSSHHSIFRGERPNARSVAWHWAYVNAMQSYLSEDLWEEIEHHYGACTKSASSDESASQFFQLATALRYAHLLYSAPLSASYGGVYNINLDQEFAFMRALEVQTPLNEYDFMRDELIDFIYDLQSGQIAHHIAEKIEPKYLEVLRSFGVQTYARSNTVSHYEHYQDISNVQELEEYVNSTGSESTFAGLEAEMKALLNPEIGGIAPNHLIEIAALYSDAQSRKSTELARLTEGHQRILVNSKSSWRDFPSSVSETDPAAMNISFEFIKSRGLYSNQSTRIGGFADFNRRLLHFFKRFRLPPS